LLVQHVANPPFQARFAGHAGCASQTEPFHLQAGDLQQVGGVVGGVCAVVQGGIIAGPLPLVGTASNGDPDQRIGPIERPDDFGQDMQRVIEAGDVGHFVQQDAALPPHGPFRHRGWKDYRRPECAPG